MQKHGMQFRPWLNLPLALVVFQVEAADAYSRRDVVPSDEPTANTRPSSCGAHAMLLIDAVCSVAGDMYTCNVRSAGPNNKP